MPFEELDLGVVGCADPSDETIAMLDLVDLEDRVGVNVAVVDCVALEVRTFELNLLLLTVVEEARELDTDAIVTLDRLEVPREGVVLTLKVLLRLPTATGELLCARTETASSSHSIPSRTRDISCSNPVSEAHAQPNFEAHRKQ